MSDITHDILAALCASDLARDVRSEFAERRSYGMDVGDATSEVVGAFNHLLNHPADGPVVIVVLAALQLRDGALDATFRDAAVDLLREGHGFQVRPGEALSSRAEREQLRASLLTAFENAPLSAAADDEPDEATAPQ